MCTTDAKGVGFVWGQDFVLIKVVKVRGSGLQSLEFRLLLWVLG